MWDAHNNSNITSEPLANAGNSSGTPDGWPNSINQRHDKAGKAMTVLTICGSVIMFSVIAWALSTSTALGTNTTQLNWLLENPWGIVSLVDLYTGFCVFSAWIWFREGSRLVSTLWTVAMMTTGWLGGCVYVLRLLTKYNGDWAWFFMGHRVR